MESLPATIVRKCHHCKEVPLQRYARICLACKAKPAKKRIRNSPEMKMFQSKYYEQNRDYLRAKQREWRESEAGQRQRFGKILRKYGITVYDWAMMWKEQDGRCAGCLSQMDMGQNTCIDHCHTTGIVRGLLCSACNISIGLLKDSVETMNRLAAYLQRQQKPKEEGDCCGKS